MHPFHHKQMGLYRVVGLQTLKLGRQTQVWRRWRVCVQSTKSSITQPLDNLQGQAVRQKVMRATHAHAATVKYYTHHPRIIGGKLSCKPQDTHQRFLRGSALVVTWPHTSDQLKKAGVCDTPAVPCVDPHMPTRVHASPPMHPRRLAGRGCVCWLPWNGLSNVGRMQHTGQRCFSIV